MLISFKKTPLQKIFRIIYCYVYGHHGPAKLTHKVNNYKYVVLKSVLSIGKKKKRSKRKRIHFYFTLKAKYPLPSIPWFRYTCNLPGICVCGMFMCVYTS